MTADEAAPSGAVVIGASGGIGSAVVDELHRRNVPVVGVDLPDAPATAPADGGYVHVPADASQPETVALVSEAVEGRDFRYVVNIAGGAMPDEVAGLQGPRDRALFESTFDANWHTSVTAVEIAKELAKAARDERPSSLSVTFCSSINSVGNFEYPVYSASKASVESLVTSLCVPLGALGIRVNAVRLGTVVTDASTSLHGDSDEHYGPLARLAALPHFPSAEQVARIIVTVAADFDCVTGTVVTADNGQSVSGIR